MELVTTIGIDRVKELEKDHSKVKIEDLKLLANHKSEEIFGFKKKNTATLDSIEEKEDDHHHADVINIDDEKE